MGALFEGEVIVGDDGTPHHAEAAELLQLAKRYGATYVYSRNAGWPANYNRMLSLVRTPYVLFLNDDAIYPKGLAELAMELLNSLSNVGMLSWVSRSISGELAETFKSGYTPDDEGKDQSPDFDTELAGFCVASRVDTLRKISGVDEGFRYYFADSDLAVRQVLDGFPTFRIQWPRIPHVEHGTIHVFKELKGDEGRDADRERFLKKWSRTGPEMRDLLCEAGKYEEEKQTILGIQRRHA